MKQQNWAVCWLIVDLVSNHIAYSDVAQASADGLSKACPRRRSALMIVRLGWKVDLRGMLARDGIGRDSGMGCMSVRGD